MESDDTDRDATAKHVHTKDILKMKTRRKHRFSSLSMDLPMGKGDHTIRKRSLLNTYLLDKGELDSSLSD